LISIMLVHVRLFARAKEIVGADRISIELPAGATVALLRRQLASKYPSLKEILARSALALKDEFAEDGSIVPAEAEVAVLPPVSGG
jgi:molybdopterin converting factor subunit 1